MEFQIGDLVTRTSHNNDTVFVITDVMGDICYLKGVNVRLQADSNMDDLVKFEEKDEEEEQFEERIKPNINLDRDDYFTYQAKYYI